MNSHGHASIWPKYGHGALGTALIALGLSGLDMTAQAMQTASDQRKRLRLVLGAWVEPPIGIEPMTYSLRVNRSGRLS